MLIPPIKTINFRLAERRTRLAVSVPVCTDCSRCTILPIPEKLCLSRHRGRIARVRNLSIQV